MSPPLTFEFTKRKRWADLLVTELSDGINLILSLSRKVLYCGPAVLELTGWRDVDFMDCDLLDFITTDSQAAFCACFEESTRSKAELLSYVRLKLNENMPSYSDSCKDVPFEIKGYLHAVSEKETEGRCFLITAKPYPSRNTAMLNTYLELKMVNEQLQRKVTELRSRAPAPPSPILSTAVPHPNPIYATSSLKISTPVIPSQQLLDSSVSYYSATNSNFRPFDDTLPAGTGGIFDSGVYDTTEAALTSAPASSIVEDDGEEGSKKKKLKKGHAQNAEQYVCITCGRTDSPEWRKGPLGPKTLCNACGLRWAKQMRRTDDPNEGSAEASTSVP